MNALTVLYGITIFSAVLPSAIAAQECPVAADLGDKCRPYVGHLAAPGCFSPGSIFVHKDQWEAADRNKIAYSKVRKLVEFMYVVDGRSLKAGYGSVFIGVDRVGKQTSESKIKLTKNKEFKFKENEGKQKYSRGLKVDGAPTQIMRRWADFPDLGNIFLAKQSNVADFDIPQAINDATHKPHARLYRFETGKISCIGFDAGLNSDVNTILGKIVDPTSGPPQKGYFQITVE